MNIIVILFARKMQVSFCKDYTWAGQTRL